MKKTTLLFPLSVLAFVALSGCKSSGGSTTSYEATVNSGGSPTSVVVTSTPSVPSVSNEGDFSLTTSDGSVSNSNNIYTISKGGTYTASGSLDGQIYIEAPESDEVVLELAGVTLSNSADSPIKGVSAGKIEISAKKDTSNSIVDNRSIKTVDDESQGEGAIYAKCDLKLKGTGTLVINASYNSGIQTTKDLTVQKQSLYVTSIYDCLKGKDSVSLTSGDLTLISKKGDGIKTVNTDKSSSNVQRGTVHIAGGNVVIDSVYDGIDASYNAVFSEENEEGVTTSITIKTGKYATYSSNYSSSNTSSKGVKAANQISVSAGKLIVQASDDGIHANYGDAFDSGAKGVGNVVIAGGEVGIASGDDGIHADNTLTVTGGTINITNASEGIESNHIVIAGGETYVYGTDDGVNASKKINETPSIDISGGLLDVTISKGDTDGIDSNGNFTQTGGLVVTRGGYDSAGGMSTGLDVDGTAKINGGTFIAFNGLEVTPSAGNGVFYAYYGTTGNQMGGGGQRPGGRGAYNGSSSTTFAAGTYTLSGGNFSKTWVNSYSYSAFLIYSNEMSTGTTYTLKNGSSTVLSWTQNSSSQQIS